MLRFTLTLLLVPSLLLTQLAATAHGHAMPHDPAHELPHFHLCLPAAAEPAEPDRDTDASRVRQNCPCDHDSDAAYLPETTTEAAGRGKSGDHGGHLWVLPVALTPFVGVDHRSVAPPTHGRSPEPTFGTCPIYVRHLALLI